MAWSHSSKNLWLSIAAFSGATAVGLGAFGSHGLRSIVSPESLAVWKTAVEYHFLHTLALLFVSMAPNAFRFRWSLRLWGIGIVLFSGSLYALVITGQRYIGIVTPFGGVAFIFGWLALVLPKAARPEDTGPLNTRDG
jgi:uncharacterized membrane protein YgdD (TMEM256/DUF423 family)